MRRPGGPDVGEGGLSAVHCFVHAEKNFVEQPMRWLVTSIDADQCMIILLTRSTEDIVPDGKGGVKVTVRRVVDCPTKYNLINWVPKAICHALDGGEASC